MTGWAFYDFVDLSGESVIEEWLEGLEPEAEAFIERRLRDMMPMRTWPEKWASKYRTTELIELRITFNKVQYRPLGCYASGFQFWLLRGAIEKGGKIPTSDIVAAEANRKEAVADEARLKKHEF